MAVYAVTSDDTLTLNGHVFVDLSDGDVTSIEFPNDMTDTKTGKNGNGIISRNRQGDNATLTLRVLRGSADDVFMQGLMQTALNNWTAQVLLNGTFVKLLGDGAGNQSHDTYTLAGGTFQKKVAGKENVEGNTDQGSAVYMLKFIDAERTLA